MSEFDKQKLPAQVEMPNGLEIRKMLESHAYEAGKTFAKRGSNTYEQGHQSVNHGSVGDVQLRVILEENDTAKAAGEPDSHQLIVRLRPRQEGLADEEGWGGQAGDDGVVRSTSIHLYDHSRPTRPGTRKIASSFRPLTEEGRVGVSLEDTDPEELAYIDSLLTQLEQQ